MEKAIRLISVERGYDPREFTLVCFGGAGPLHACALARALDIPRVMVPAMPGALSALGILMSDVVRDYSRTVMIAAAALLSQSRAFNRKGREGLAKVAKKNKSDYSGANEDVLALLEPYFSEVEAKGAAEFREEGLVGIASRSADLRYAGQGYEINVPAGQDMLSHFHEAQRKRYGHADETRKIEIVNVRVRMIATSGRIEFPRKAAGGADSDHAVVKRKRVMFGGAWLETPVFQRDLLAPQNQFQGPAIVHEYSATTIVPPACRVAIDDYSNLVIEV